MANLSQQDIREYLSKSRTGYWKLEVQPEKPVKMYADSNMVSLLGLPEAASAEENYAFLVDHILPEDRKLLEDFGREMRNGDAVADFEYNHPDRGQIRLRCTGKWVKQEAGVEILMGFDQEISNTVQLGAGQKRTNALLRQNRTLKQEQVIADNYHKQLMDMASCGILAYTIPGHRVLHMNQEALRVCGAEEDKSLEEHLKQLLKHAVYQDPSVLGKLKALPQTGGELDYECVITNSKGYSTNLMLRSKVFYTPQGEQGIFTTFLDISDSVTLRNEKGILEALCTDFTGVYLCDLQADTMVPIKCSLPVEKAFASREMGEDGGHFSKRMEFFQKKYLISESAPDFLEKMSGAYLQTYLTDHDRFAYRFRTRPTTTGYQYFEAQAVRLKGDKGFKVVLGFRYMDDILREEEQRKTALENALARSNRKNEIISGISKLYWQIFELDLQTGTYHEVFVDGSFTMEKPRYTGIVRGDFERAIQRFADPAYQTQMEEFLNLQTLNQRLAAGDTVVCEYKTRAGLWVSARLIAESRDDTGSVTRALFLLQTIDAQKRLELDYQKKLEQAAEDARRANEAKTNFLRRMSHDIRTPINGIIGMLKIAERHTDDARKIWDCTEKALSASQQLLALVNDVLDIGKLEANEILVENQPFDLAHTLLDFLSAADAYAVQYGVAITGGRASSTFEHRYLIGSANLLSRILMNLVSNGVKYNHAGGSVFLSCTELPAKGNIAWFRFICQDTGIGMSPEFQKRAFEPYTQEGKISNTSFSGTGLGLAIVKKIVEQMGGSITLESKENVGSKFTILLPFAINDHAPVKMGERHPENYLNLSGQRALLAEDNELNREIAEALFAELGLEVVSVKDGAEAVERFKASDMHEFDYIFMDVMMPVMDGLEATRVIRKLSREDAKTVPILAVSANAFQDDIQQSLDAGMNAHLTKPLELNKIRQAIYEILHKRS